MRLPPPRAGAPMRDDLFCKGDQAPDSRSSLNRAKAAELSRPFPPRILVGIFLGLSPPRARSHIHMRRRSGPGQSSAGAGPNFGLEPKPSSYGAAWTCEAGQRLLEFFFSFLPSLVSRRFSPSWQRGPSATTVTTDSFGGRQTASWTLVCHPKHNGVNEKHAALCYMLWYGGLPSGPTFLSR